MDMLQLSPPRFGDIISTVTFMQQPMVPQGVMLKHAHHDLLRHLNRHLRNRLGSHWINRSLYTRANRAFRPVLLGGCLTTLLMTASPGRSAELLLYKLETQCTQEGAAAVNCTVEAINEGKSTRYRHHIGQTIKTVRITDDPLTMTLWNPETKRWQSLNNASGRFSTNTVCFNDQDLCVINPNYLNSVRQDNPTKMAGRDLVRVHFGSDGRIDASCFDAGCEVVKR